MSLLNVTQLKQHIETDVDAEALARYLESAEAEIDAQVGTDESAGEARRRQVLIDLVKLAIRYEGLQRSGIGNVSFDIGNYAEARYNIISALFPRVQVD